MAQATEAMEVTPSSAGWIPAASRFPRQVGVSAVVAACAALYGCPREDLAPPQLDAWALLDSVRAAYTNLDSYVFEHSVRVEEVEPGGQATRRADLILFTASDSVRGEGSDVPMPPPFNSRRFRLALAAGGDSVVQTCAGHACWSYSSWDDTWQKGETLSDVTTSVAGSMLLGIHLLPLAPWPRESVREAQLVGEEILEIAGDRRQVFVVHATLERTARPDSLDDEPPSDQDAITMLLGVSGYLSFVQMQGLAGEDPTSYEPGGASRDAPRLRLWIDRNSFAILRRELTEDASRVAESPNGDRTLTPVQLRLTDEFGVATIDRPVPDTLLRFSPPATAREIPNQAVRRAEAQP